MIARRKLLKVGATGLAASVAMPFVGRTGWAAAPTHTLKLTFADTQSHPLYDVLKRFSEDVSKRTSGAIDIQVFSIGQLGSGTNILTGLQTGIIDFCAHTSGFIDTIFPKFQVVDLPFLFSDSASAERLLDGPTGAKLLDMLPTKGIYGLGWGHWGWRVVSTIDRKAPEPADMKGLKIRVQPGAIFAATFKALGASPVAIDLTEVYLALSQHVIDAVETPMISLAATKHDEIVNTINLTNQVYNVGVMMASKSKFDALAEGRAGGDPRRERQPHQGLAHHDRRQERRNRGALQDQGHDHRRAQPRGLSQGHRRRVPAVQGHHRRRSLRRGPEGSRACLSRFRRCPMASLRR